jgi:hypothetical protein
VADAFHAVSNLPGIALGVVYDSMDGVPAGAGGKHGEGSCEDQGGFEELSFHDFRAFFSNILKLAPSQLQATGCLLAGEMISNRPDHPLLKPA